ncbi:MAG: trypsin-like peptidase domain-containing protein, partial [Planctomycetota bacterium]|nr:trypsin-like peptidase domain-containing protein [Planctomycetota bacterium]
MRTGSALLLLAATLCADLDLEKARAKVRALEAEIQVVVARVAPAVGAVSNYRARFDEKTGKVTLLPAGMGSGCIVTRDGFLLTNVHVVRGAARLTVALNDGHVYEADLFADTSTGRVQGDIALLKLYGRERWPYVDWTKGDERRLEPGSFVFAMGNPFGHALDGQPVVTLGVVSGAGRVAAETGFKYVGAIQTDAEINPGNSGGPLFSADGRFIGINGLMSSRAGRFNSGVGFAIPITQIKRFMPKLLKEPGSEVSYGYHGLRVDSAPGEAGARVTRIDGGAPALDAGLRRGDVLTRINGKKVANRSDFVNLVGQLPEKRVVRVIFKRGRNTKTGSFKLGSQADAPSSPKPVGKAPPLPLHERAFLGAEFKESAEGPELTRIVPGAAASRAKLKTGDVILRLGKTDINSGKKLVDALAVLEKHTKTRIFYRRAGRRMEGPIVLSDAA